MDMIVAAGGGERDYAVDAAILAALPEAADPDLYLNEHLLADIRPTLFLAQLSNLLAGNISIVHGVIGSSRTFMGEEASGADALRIACARIEAGQSDICLVGGSFNAQRPDVFLHDAMGHALWRGPLRPVRGRARQGGGLVFGSVGCFLVDRKPRPCRGPGCRRQRRVSPAFGPTVAARTLVRRRCHAAGQIAGPWRRRRRQRGHFGRRRSRQLADDEKIFLDRLGLPVRSPHRARQLRRAIFPASVALAAMTSRGTVFPPLEPAETPLAGTLKGLFVTSLRHLARRGHRAARPGHRRRA